MIPLNPLLMAYLVAYGLSTGSDLALDGLNAFYLKRHGDRVPHGFEGLLEEQELDRMNRYTLENIRFGIAYKAVRKTVFLLLILSGVLPWLARILGHTSWFFGGLVFFGFPGLVLALASLPFDYYHTFVVEQRYGFNTRTRKLWLSDLGKGFLVVAFLGSGLLLGVLFLAKYGGPLWWIWAWGLFFSFQLLMLLLYPSVIAPLFNKFTPIQDPALARKIEVLAKKEGLTLKGIYQMDATKRSRHSNAYFSGLGVAKRVVLYDSLLASHSEDEILAVLAHEMGHLKRNHIKKQLLLTGLFSGLLFFLGFKMIGWKTMYSSFGFSNMSTYVGLFLTGLLWEPVGFFLSPIPMALSRRYEYEADRYSVKLLRGPQALSDALKRLAKENLSNLRPHPLYVWFHGSHPPLAERIERLQRMEGAGMDGRFVRA